MTYPVSAVASGLWRFVGIYRPPLPEGSGRPGRGGEPCGAAAGRQSPMRSRPSWPTTAGGQNRPTPDHENRCGAGGQGGTSNGFAAGCEPHPPYWFAERRAAPRSARACYAGSARGAQGGAMSRELRLLQETNRRAREAEAEVARLTQALEQREQEGWRVAHDERAALAATVARLERRLAAERHQAARDLAAHDRDRRSAQRQLRAAAGALHRAVLATCAVSPGHRSLAQRGEVRRMMASGSPTLP